MAAAAGATAHQHPSRLREDMEQTSRWAASQRAWAVLLRSTRQATIGVRCGARQQQRMRERVRAAILRTGSEHRRKTRWVVGARLASTTDWSSPIIWRV